MIRIPAVWALAISCLPTQAAIVEGYVTYGDGSPVFDALVDVTNPYLARASVVQYVHTDRKGFFRYGGLSPGPYMVFASKPKEGYGDPESSFLAAGRAKVPEVTIHTPEETITVTVNMGAAGGFLDGKIISQDSQQPVANARVMLQLEREPDKFQSFSANEQGAFDSLVPAQPIVISVQVPGYQPSRTVMKVSSGEHKIVTITLKRSS